MSAASKSGASAQPVSPLAPPVVTRVAILINPAAGGGRAGRRWGRIRSAVLARLPPHPVECVLSPGQDLATELRGYSEREGVNGFVVVGGDGSVHHLLNTLLSPPEENRPAFAIGAVGLGSSNDFHKPYRTRLGEAPVRLDWHRPTAVDIGRLRYRATDGTERQRFFVLNASMGVTAAANHFFNQGDTTLRLLKKNWTAAAIQYAAVRTILTYRNYPATLHFQDTTATVALSNLAILKNPHISGSLRYDQAIGPADGRFGLNLCDGMNRLDLLKLLLDLSRGQFSGRPKRHSHYTRSVRIEVADPVPLEADGEVYLGTDFELTLLPRHIYLFGHES